MKPSTAPRGARRSVSIITVVRNDRCGLSRTIASIRSQSHRSIEFIVVDGASDDGTVEIIHSNEDVIDYWQSQPDEGIYDAMNRGLQIASGELVLFLNAGDTFLERESLAKAVAAAGRRPAADIFYFVAVGPDGRRAGRFVRPAAILVDSVGNHQAVLVRCCVHKRFVFDTRYRIKADRDVQLRMYASGCRVESIPQVISRFEGGGVSSTAIVRKEWENVLICCQHRVGWGRTSIAMGLALVRLSLYGLAHISGIGWQRTKRLLSAAV